MFSTHSQLLNLATSGRTLRVLALLCALCWFPALAPAQTPSSDLVEELRLPLDKITPDLLPDRVPVPLKDYQALKTLAETTRDTPSTTRLIKAGYTATYSGGRLVAGRLAWTFENTSGLAQRVLSNRWDFPFAI